MYCCARVTWATAFDTQTQEVVVNRRKIDYKMMNKEQQMCYKGCDGLENSVLHEGAEYAQRHKETRGQ